MTDVFTWPVGRAAQPDSGYTRVRHRAPVAPVASYVLSAGLGGAVVGAGFAQLGVAIRGSSPEFGVGIGLAALVVAALAVSLELAGRVSPLPQRHAQVPRRWLSWQRTALTATAFGLIIGSGVLTRLQHATAYVLAAGALLAPTVLTGLFIGLMYGLTRGLTLAVTWLIDARGRRRPPWEALSVTGGRAARVLAATALVTMVIVGVLGSGEVLV